VDVAADSRTGDVVRIQSAPDAGEPGEGFSYFVHVSELSHERK
jgi:hypothetical protein